MLFSMKMIKFQESSLALVDKAYFAINTSSFSFRLSFYVIRPQLDLGRLFANDLSRRPPTRLKARDRSMYVYIFCQRTQLARVSIQSIPFAEIPLNHASKNPLRIL